MGLKVYVGPGHGQLLPKQQMRAKRSWCKSIYIYGP